MAGLTAKQRFVSDPDGTTRPFNDLYHNWLRPRNQRASSTQGDDESPETVDWDRWAILLSDAKEVTIVRVGISKRTPGEHPTKGGLIIAGKWRFGPYVMHNHIYALDPGWQNA